MSFLFSSNVEVSIQLDGQDSRKKVEMKVDENKKESYYLYYDGETVSGKVNVTFKKHGTKLDHQGIKIEFIGQIELFNDKGNRHDFTSLVRDLANPGELTQNTSFPFEFVQVEKQYESYIGVNAKLQYLLRVTVVKRLSDIVKEQVLAVHTLSHYPETNNSIKMEVGIEDCLHIEFEYSKSKYDLGDVIVGKIYFLLVRVKLKQMELTIIRSETTDSLAGESIPIRLFLSGYDLTPTMKDINKKFSVRYYINLVLVDEEDRRYFKQQEITLFRKAERPRRTQQSAALQQIKLHQEQMLDGQVHSTFNTSGNNNNNNSAQQLPASEHYSGPPEDNQAVEYNNALNSKDS